jgi:hypothetical protein
VNNSSQEPIYTITLDNTSEDEVSNTITLSPLNSIPIQALTSSDIITLTGGSMYNYSSPVTIGQIETVDLSGIESFTSFTNLYKEEFDGRFPDYERVMEMCKEYPGLEIAYRKFKEVYKMVKEDYDGKQRERRNTR